MEWERGYHAPTHTPSQIARATFTDFDWLAYDAARQRESRYRMTFGANRHNRRLTDITPEKPKDLRSKEEKMSDKAIVTTGETLINLAERKTKEEYLKAVRVAYTAGREQLTEVQQNAVALVAWSMGLDPSPAMGHIYAWNDWQGFHVYIGYQAWIYKARALGRQFVYTTRVMTPDEQIAHGLKNGDIGAICELFDVDSAKMWQSMGLTPRPIVGIGVWQKAITTKSGTTKQDNVPNGRTPLWVAEKRATTDALKHMGLGFGQMTIQSVEGMQWDNSQGQYIASEGELARPPEGLVTEGEYIPEGDYDVVTSPFSPEALLDELRAEAEATRSEKPTLINPQQMKHLHAAFDKLSKSDIEIKAFVQAVFGHNSRKQLAACEYEAVVNWIATDEELARQEWLMWVASYQQSVQGKAVS